MKRTLLLFVLLLVVSIGAFAQTHNIAGKVLDENGKGYQAAGVYIKGTTTGTITDANGNFNIDVPDGKHQLVIQALGYNTIYVRDSGQSEITVKLTLNARTLEGAVVTALGIKREKREVGFSLPQVIIPALRLPYKVKWRVPTSAVLQVALAALPVSYCAVKNQSLKTTTHYSL
jgi:hypothetical protein